MGCAVVRIRIRIISDSAGSDAWSSHWGSIVSTGASAYTSARSLVSEESATAKNQAAACGVISVVASGAFINAHGSGIVGVVLDRGGGAAASVVALLIDRIGVVVGRTFQHAERYRYVRVERVGRACRHADPVCSVSPLPRRTSCMRWFLQARQLWLAAE